MASQPLGSGEPRRRARKPDGAEGVRHRQRRGQAEEARRSAPPSQLDAGMRPACLVARHL